MYVYTRTRMHICLQACMYVQHVYINAYTWFVTTFIFYLSLSVAKLRLINTTFIIHPSSGACLRIYIYAQRFKHWHLRPEVVCIHTCITRLNIRVCLCI